MAAGRSHLNSVEVARILALVRNSGNGNGNGNGGGNGGGGNGNGNNQVPPDAQETLRRGIAELWQRLQADPDNYVMNRHEFQLFNYYRAELPDQDLVRRATARFWDNFRGEPSDVLQDGD